MKYSTKRTIAFVMSLAVLAGTAPTNFGGFIWRDTAIVAHAIEDVAFNNEVSLTLGDDLALNFYAVGINESNVAEYTVKFSGKCVEKESGFTVKNGKYCAATHIYARNINADITATLYNGTTKIGDSITYSAAKYLNALDEVTTDSKTKQLISASQLFGIASAEYFNGGDLGYAEALNKHLLRINKTEADLITEAGKYAFTASDAMISLVLDSKTAIRVYIKDVPAGTEASGYTSIASTSDKANAGYPSFFEITGLTPEMLNKEHTITVKDTDYTFSGLSWASRILSKTTSSEKNIKMSKALVAYFMAADEYASVDVTSVAIDDKSMNSLAKGKTLKLSATVDNAATNKTIVWSSSDDTVASVDNTGEVTANEAGTAIITVTATNGTEETSDDKTDSITITVSNPAAGISLNTSALTLTKGGTDNTATLTATVTPDDADDTTVTWETSDSTVATVSNGEVTGNNAGTAIITATNKSGQKAVCVVTVQNLVDLSTLTATEYEAQDGDVLTGTSNASQIITVNEGTVTLRDATINGLLRYYGDGTLTLEGTNTNTVTGSYSYCPAVYISPDKTLTINGTGSLNASGFDFGAGIGAGGYGISCGNIVIESGTINATGGMFASGIGGGHGGSCGNITINGGIITATGDMGPGIGGGYNVQGYDASCGNITINGGTITAAGDAFAAGIGGGYGTSCGKITINDGTVIANKGGQATYSIGAGETGTCDTVTVYGTEYPHGIDVSPFDSSSIHTENTIDLSVISTDYEAQDGDVLTGTLGGNYKISVADGAKIKLRDVTINGSNDQDADENGLYNWAGITCNGDATLTLEGTNKVKGFYENYPGVYIPENKTLTITGTGSLDASSNGYGAGIGGGNKIPCGNIVINKGTITAAGGNSAAGIGSGNEASCGDITISGGTIGATSEFGAAGIGSGIAASCGNITISGGEIFAGGVAGAGIGSGSMGASCANITIRGGSICAMGSRGGAGIGSGFASSCNDITISSGRGTVSKDDSTPYNIGAGMEGLCGTVTIGEVEGAISTSPYNYP